MKYRIVEYIKKKPKKNDKLYDEEAVAEEVIDSLNGNYQGNSIFRTEEVEDIYD